MNYKSSLKIYFFQDTFHYIIKHIISDIPDSVNVIRQRLSRPYGLICGSTWLMMMIFRARPVNLGRFWNQKKTQELGLLNHFFLFLALIKPRSCPSPDQSQIESPHNLYDINNLYYINYNSYLT